MPAAEIKCNTDDQSNRIVMAQEAVLATTELLEAILLALPPRDILLVQRVSKRFETVVKQSTTLQCALFLQPVKDSPLHFVFSGEQEHMEFSETEH